MYSAKSWMPAMPESLERIVDHAHRYIRPAVSPGDAAVDATAGNGGDTLFLAGLVGPAGLVYAFDLQPEAIDNTRRLLDDRGFLNRARLIRDDHGRLRQYVTPGVSAVMFNLGYRPGGDKRVTTTAATTCRALPAALNVMRVGGRLSVACYPGHAGGMDETLAVEEFCARLPSGRFTVVGLKMLNRAARAPRLIIVEKKAAWEVAEFAG